MCGISGWVGRPDAEAAARMRSLLRHRGPDEQGEYADESATLLHERLSIIDVKGGRQPMASEDGRYRIIFNGEIYNHVALRQELTAKGHRFATQCDTEVIVHLYEEMGERCPERLHGMFAFAIWDSRAHTLFLARDRMGIKPLFYAQAGEGLIFASELKAILAHGAVRRELDPEGLDHYLTFMYVPAPRTIIRTVRKLLPGHSLTFRGGRAQLRRYWELPPAEAALPDGKMSEGVESLGALLKESVRCRLMSEVPLGAYLSGGLDSSLVVALMNQTSTTRVNTFSVGFEEQGFDERRWARIVAERFKTRHQELVVGHHSVSELPAIIRALDEPVADSAAVPTYFMAQLTKPHVTVVLTGEGADELFAGYSHYKILTMADRMALLSPGAAARWLAGMLGSGAAGRGAEYAGKLRDRAQAYMALKSVFTAAEKRRLYAPEHLSRAGALSPPDEVVRRFLVRNGEPYLQQLLRLDLSTWLPDDLLVKVDRMTMAHGVEARVPFLDHRVVEAVMRMPPAWKLKGFTGKRILRETARKLLPPEIVARRKTGFAVPVGEWAAGEMREMVADLLSPAAVKQRGLFDPLEVTLLAALPHYNMFDRRRLWTLICLELWCREFMR